MKHTPVTLDPASLPAVFAPYLKEGRIYDSSCSPEARVLFLDIEGGLYLKSAARGSLCTEAAMDRCFHRLGIGPEVVEYLSADRDYLLTAALDGKDATDGEYLSDPKRLSVTTATLLRALHGLSTDSCPVRNRTASYLQTVARNADAGIFDPTFSPRFARAADALACLRSAEAGFRADTLIHGDYCLPNLMLKDWTLSGYLDLGGGGVGEKHIDLFWGAWTLGFNLHTDAYRDRFLDAYGREAIDDELLLAVEAAECFA